MSRYGVSQLMVRDAANVAAVVKLADAIVPYVEPEKPKGEVRRITIILSCFLLVYGLQFSAPLVARMKVIVYAGAYRGPGKRSRGEAEIYQRDGTHILRECYGQVCALLVVSRSHTDLGRQWALASLSDPRAPPPPTARLELGRVTSTSIGWPAAASSLG